MAQWLEHRSRKPGVGSSNLPGGTPVPAAKDGPLGDLLRAKRVGVSGEVLRKRGASGPAPVA